MKTILVATDFSDAAHSAALYAAELARISGAKILLYHANLAPNISANKEIAPKESDSNENKKLLESEASLLKKLSGGEVDYLFAEGAAAKGIISIEKIENPDLVIVGMRESAVFRKFIFGHVSTEVINETLTPIIVVPEKYRFENIERIGFGIDFNFKSEIAMHGSVRALYQIFKPKTFVINIVKEGAAIRPNDPVSEMNVEKYFENKGHVYGFIQDNDLIRGLKEYVSWHKINLLVMMPRKPSVLGKIFVESQTKKMAFNTDIPLLILPLE